MDGKALDEEAITGSPLASQNSLLSSLFSSSLSSTPSPILTQDQIQELYDVFEMFDKDHDGQITIKELGTTLHLLLGQAPSEDDLQLMFTKADVDKNGVIDFDEFKELMGAYLVNDKTNSNAIGNDNALNENLLLETFRVFDTDRDGFIGVKELRHVMLSIGENLTDNELKSMIKAADQNGDGRIDFDEFKHMMTMAKETQEKVKDCRDEESNHGVSSENDEQEEAGTTSFESAMSGEEE